MGKPYFAHTNLGLAMVKKGWSVTDLSFETRINTRYIGYYLKGEKAMTPDHLRKMAETLGVDPRDIFQTEMEMRVLDPHQDHNLARRTDVRLRAYS